MADPVPKAPRRRRAAPAVQRAGTPSFPMREGWRQRLGRRGEAQARAFLEGRGYQVLVANYRCPWGEVDLIARDGQDLVFVEVKARSSSAFGAAEEAITPAKAQRLLRCAEHYLAEQGGLDLSWRVDVVAISRRGPDAPLQVTLIKNAVTGD